MKSSISSINMVLVGLSLVLWFVLLWFCFGWKSPDENNQKCPFLYKLDASPPRRRKLLIGEDLRLGEPETPLEQFLFCLGMALLRLGEPLRLSVALIRLGKPATMLLFPSFS